MVVQKQPVSSVAEINARDRTTVWALEKTIDGHFTPETYFGTERDARDALELIIKHMSTSRNWRVKEYEVWMDAQVYVERETTHTAKWLRAHMDPEWADYVRLQDKFKDAFK